MDFTSKATTPSHSFSVHLPVEEHLRGILFLDSIVALPSQSQPSWKRVRCTNEHLRGEIQPFQRTRAGRTHASGSIIGAAVEVIRTTPVSNSFGLFGVFETVRFSAFVILRLQSTHIIHLLRQRSPIVRRLSR